MEPEVRTIQPFRGPALVSAGAVGGLALWYGCFPSMYYMAWLFFVMLLWTVPIIVAGAHVAMQALWQRVRGRRVRAEMSGIGFMLAWVLLCTTAVLFKAPLRVHFAMARSTLDEIRREPTEHTRSAAGFQIDDVREGRCDTSRRLFHIRNDDSFFVYSPHGVDGLCYNTGSHGALGGGWYWMVED